MDLGQLHEPTDYELEGRFSLAIASAEFITNED